MYKKCVSKKYLPDRSFKYFFSIKGNFLAEREIRSRVFSLTRKSLDPVSRYSPFPRRLEKAHTSLRLSHPYESKTFCFLSLPRSLCSLRRERDSNPRCPFGHDSFQDCSLQPLGHLSNTHYLLYRTTNERNSFSRQGGIAFNHSAISPNNFFIIRTFQIKIKVWYTLEK